MLAGMSSAGGRPAPATRARLIGAAERLFASQGIDGVSLREINRASGARNSVAVQYHFADRAGVVRAVLDKHRPAVEAARHAMLDRIDGLGRPTQRDLADALVRPLAAKLTDPDGGRAFLQIYAELINRPRPVFDPLDTQDEAHSVVRWRRVVEPHLDEQALRLHRRFIAIRFNAVELGRRAADEPRADDRLFTSQLVDLVTALLGARISAETQRLIQARSGHDRSATATTPEDP